MNRSGLFPYALKGGYQAFCTIRDQFLQSDFQFIVIRGLTGSGKTELLSRLERRGRQCLNLEKLARHRGSAFGQYLQEDQPSNEQFNNLVFQTLFGMKIKQPIYVEYKGSFIGRVQIPIPVFEKICKPFKSYYLEVPREKRVENICARYQNIPGTILFEMIEKIKPRLTTEEFTQGRQFVQSRAFDKLVDILLNYYDQSEGYQNDGLSKIIKEPFLLDLELI